MVPVGNVVVEDKQVGIFRVSKHRSEIAAGWRTGVTALGLKELDNGWSRHPVDMNGTIASWWMWVKASVGWGRDI